MTQKIDMTVEEAARQLRQMAELTARASQNWENFEAICRDFLRAALTHGQQTPPAA